MKPLNFKKINLCSMKTLLADAPELMASGIAKLGDQFPEYTNQSGVGFWPIPLYFPRFLSRCIDLIQEEITDHWNRKDADTAGKLIDVRIRLLRLVYEGDLGENHLGAFIADHPFVTELSAEVELPFSQFCLKILEVDDAITLLGILMRNEEGSLAEAHQLVNSQIINVDGTYGKLHLEEEVEHGRLATEIHQIIEGIPALNDRYLLGFEMHDEWYMSPFDR